MNKYISGVSVSIWIYLALGIFIDFGAVLILEIKVGTLLMLLILFISLWYILEVNKIFKKREKSFSFSIRKQIYK